MSITITEALSEVNLLKKKIEDADVGIRSMLVRAAHVPDLYAHHGGAEEVVRKTQQSSSDLRKRLIEIRSKISEANIKNQLTINGETRSIFDWLSWKREIYPGLERSLKEQIQTIKASVQKESERPEVWKDHEGKVQIVTYIRNADLKTLEDEYLRLVDTYGKLDGQLSLKNATLILN